MPTDLTLYLDDEPGELARVGDVLGEAGANISGLCALTFGGGQAEVHILVQDATTAFEALHNAAKHSGARTVCISITESKDSFTLTVADDGRGFREGEIEPGRGLHSLRQRAAQLRAVLNLNATPGQGTTIRLHVPHP